MIHDFELELIDWAREVCATHQCALRYPKRSEQTSTITLELELPGEFILVCIWETTGALELHRLPIEGTPEVVHAHVSDAEALKNFLRKQVLV